MKENSKKSLLLLYSTDEKAKILGETEKVTEVLQDLVPGGRRAMVSWWQKQGWIESVSTPNGRYLALTALGRSALQEELAFFQIPPDWEGEWEVVIFREAPERDPAFHNLRAMLRRNGALMVSRGVYAFVNKVPLAIKQKCAVEYAHNVSVIRVIMGDQRDLNDLAVKSFNIYDQISLYSGISREIDTLLIEFELQKRLNYSQKIQIHSLYNRFFAVFCGDNGLMSQFFPSAPHPLQMLSKIQRLWF